jgi:DNA-binding protein HU-beta
MAAKAPKSKATKTTAKATATSKTTSKKEMPAQKTTAKKAAAKPMTKTELINHFAEKFSLPKQKVRDFFDEQARLAVAQARVGFTIPGLGKLVIRQYKAREGRNPRTGEKIEIKARERLKFVVSAAAMKAAGLE